VPVSLLAAVQAPTSLPAQRMPCQKPQWTHPVGEFLARLPWPVTGLSQLAHSLTVNSMPLSLPPAEGCSAR
jgi:hypothetical protein